MSNNQTERKDQDSKKILTLILLIAVFMFSTTGATYAFFAISASSNNTLTGTAASGSIIITNGTATTASAPALIAPAVSSNQSLPMVPQISHNGATNILQKALTGASGKDKCVDGNGNVICRAYTFSVRNNSTGPVDVRGSITFNSKTFADLRWKLMESATTVTVSIPDAVSLFSATQPIKALHNSKIYFDTTNVALAANGGTKQYWLIVWIEETGQDQSQPIGTNPPVEENDQTSIGDWGTWTATIAFDAVNESGTAIGGITSTITS